jgi:hypothetical protein
MPVPPQIIPIAGGTATDVDLTAEGVAYDGDSRLSWPFSRPNPYQDARFVVSGSVTASDGSLDMALHDYSAGSDVVTLPDVSGDGSQIFSLWDPGQVDATSTLGLKVTVTEPSDQNGATGDFEAKVVLLP